MRASECRGAAFFFSGRPASLGRKDGAKRGLEAGGRKLREVEQNGKEKHSPTSERRSRGAGPAAPPPPRRLPRVAGAGGGTALLRQVRVDGVEAHED